MRLSTTIVTTVGGKRGSKLAHVARPFRRVFESRTQRFVRMEFVGENRFHLAFMRYTGAWVVLYHDLSLDDCLTATRDDPWLQVV